MKIQILDREGKKVKEIETKLFEEPIRIDIISKVVEAEKMGQPYSSKFRAGMDRSASGNVRHRRHVWKSHYGKGMSRVPRKTAWRRGTQFSWEGAIVPSTRGGRRAHPPKGSVNLKKINKKEFRKALLSALSYITDNKELSKKYHSLDKVDNNLPLVIVDKVFELKTKDFLDSLKKILGELYSVGIQKKSVRAGIGKMRGRKYKKNAGLLFVVGKDEDKNVNGIEVIKVPDLMVRDLADNGARLTLFSERAVEELNGLVEKKFGKEEKVRKEKKEKVDRRKVKRESRKKVEKNKSSKVPKSSKDDSEKISKSSKDDSGHDGVKEDA